jgi:GSCFA family
VQLFDRAYGHFKPRLEYWQRPNGRYVDPYRPEAVPGGFATSEAVIADRDAHFAAVRRVFEQLEVFVFTFGLTEGWLVKEDGAALQLAPGVSGGEFDTEKYLFRNARPDEVAAEFIAFVDRLRSVNAKSKVIVSVSPVPMIATYESRHILVSNSYTKSALRCAADEIASARPNISYFPSYEMVTGSANGAQYYAADQRTITDTGVRAVIKLFLDHYTERSKLHPSEIDTRRESAKVAERAGNDEAIHNVLRGAPTSGGAGSVSERGPVYSKKFDISGDHKIAIAGATFARHLTRHLKANGYNVLDVEPPPPHLPEPLHRKYGFCLYSARYGDISTVHQLLQLAKEAAGEFQPVDICWQRGGKFYDALRPTVEPDGLDSEEELYRHRKYHVRQVHELLHSMDVLVFTLGLTDAWIHKSSGTVYPTAPGVLAGELDDSKHAFVNYEFCEIQSAFMQLVQVLNSIRKGSSLPRILLTISPEPLTATASGRHILEANEYSKAVLRAVAGQLASKNSYIDYLPLYEISTHQMAGDTSVEQNLRSVSAEGAEAAIKVFLDRIAPSIPRSTDKTPDFAKQGHSPVDAVECEETILEAFAK